MKRGGVALSLWIVVVLHAPGGWLKEKLEKTRIEAGLGIELPEDAGARTIEDGLDVEADAVYDTGGTTVVYRKKCPGAKILAGLTS
jgi:hypothetical protein